MIKILSCYYPPFTVRRGERFGRGPVQQKLQKKVKAERELKLQGSLATRCSWDCPLPSLGGSVPPPGGGEAGGPRPGVAGGRGEKQKLELWVGLTGPRPCRSWNFSQ